MPTRPDGKPADPEPAAPWWKCVAAAVPLGLVAAQFLSVALARKPLLGASARTLTSLMQVEFLAIHSMAFLGLLALWKPQDAAGQRTRAVVFWGTFALYCAMAASRGFESLVMFFGLSFVTYLGLFLNWRSPTALVQLGARWVVGFALFLAALGLFDAPKNAGEWTGRASVIRAGAAYFVALAALEFSGLYQRWLPRHAPRIARAFRTSRR